MTKNRGTHPVIHASKRTCSICAIALCLFSFTGCNMDDPMIKEMEIAYATSSEKKNITHEKRQQEREEAVLRVVQKYFPEGMKAEDALHQLKKHGFEIRENRLDGMRMWPEGKIIPYPNETTKQNILKIDPKGQTLFYTANKSYDYNIMKLSRKRVIIIFRVIDNSGTISEVTGNIWADGV